MVSSPTWSKNLGLTLGQAPLKYVVVLASPAYNTNRRHILFDWSTLKILHAMQYDVGIAYHVFLRPWLRKRFAKGRLVNGIIFSHGRQFAVKVPTKLNSCQKSNPLISRPFLNSFTCYLKKILAQNHMHFIQIKALHHMQNIIKTSSKIKIFS